MMHPYPGCSRDYSRFNRVTSLSRDAQGLGALSIACAPLLHRHIYSSIPHVRGTAECLANGTAQFLFSHRLDRLRLAQQKLAHRGIFAQTDSAAVRGTSRSSHL
jgi:hypothetical protein